MLLGKGVDLLLQPPLLLRVLFLRVQLLPLDLHDALQVRLGRARRRSGGGRRSGRRRLARRPPVGEAAARGGLLLLLLLLLLGLVGGGGSRAGRAHGGAGGAPGLGGGVEVGSPLVGSLLRLVDDAEGRQLLPHAALTLLLLIALALDTLLEGVLHARGALVLWVSVGVKCGCATCAVVVVVDAACCVPGSASKPSASRCPTSA